MPSNWLETTTGTDVDHDAVLQQLQSHGVLDLAKKLMDEDTQGVTRPSLSTAAAKAVLDDACRA